MTQKGRERSGTPRINSSEERYELFVNTPDSINHFSHYKYSFLVFMKYSWVWNKYKTDVDKINWKNCQERF